MTLASDERSASREKLVVVGNGMAGMRTVEELLKLAPDRYEITVFGAEPHGNYNRIMLSPLLAGDKHFDDIVLNSHQWYEEHGIRLCAGDPAVAIDRERRIVRSARGREVAYDRLLLATGSQPFRIPVPGVDLPGVLTFRTLEDVQTMIAAAERGGTAVVIGGGLLGLEAASALNQRGMKVTVVHVAACLMERQLDTLAAELLRETLEKRGLQFALAAQTEAFVGDSTVRAVRLKGGVELPADLVVMTAGVRPDIALARDAGLACERAILVDDTLQTQTDPCIYAVGECVQHRGSTFGLVAPLWEQAKVCAAYLAGVGGPVYVQTPLSAKLKVSGVGVFSAGDLAEGSDRENLVLRDHHRGIYKRLVLRDNRIIGVMLYGEANDGPWYFDMIQQARDVAALRSKLVFGRCFCER